ncbi:hypothetical protein BN12_1570011 [Nostocoides japonicum T1-X7]|uniref:Uncharacterized protein n=1 Tax=Nostocoides japonicum T1-X7 TaxID=1194083 RepID=A0A077LU53_9MICO|nr:hypothetical protein [Tetrasphaera japonica]CCH76996.1 hypothetical protein BN12_1570011 [Tetrasphaera japonica T1-X7]
MAVYVWAQYYYAAPVNRNISSYEICYGKKHVHGLQPTPQQIAEVSADLLNKVTAAGTTAGQIPPVPAGYAAEIRTRSAH